MPIADKLVAIGWVAGIYGVRGWIKVHSHTDPRDNIAQYPEWTLTCEDLGTEAGRKVFRVESCERHGKHILAKLDGVDDREKARELIDCEIAVPRSQLPVCDPGQYYWTDLEGLKVVNKQGHELGRVDYLIGTGAHDVLMLAGKGNRMIPFVLGKTVMDVDLERGTITVDWVAEYWDA